MKEIVVATQAFHFTTKNQLYLPLLYYNDSRILTNESIQLRTPPEL